MDLGANKHRLPDPLTVTFFRLHLYFPTLPLGTLSPPFLVQSFAMEKGLAGFGHMFHLQGRWCLIIVPAWVATCLWFPWGWQADAAVPAEGMDTSQCTIPVAGSKATGASGKRQALRLGALPKLRASVFLSQESEWAASNDWAWFPSWADKLPPACLLQVPHSVPSLGHKPSVLCLPQEPSCAEVIGMNLYVAGV